MSESTQPSERPPKDPVRIVYHTEKRTFARLFNEHSLEQVKDVVRRKLGLGRDTDVSLKQMGLDTLLDLEDDDDFQAFCVLVRASVSVDIQVMVGRSQGVPVPPMGAPVDQPIAIEESVKPSKKRQERPSVSEPAAASPSRQPAAVAQSGQPSMHPEAARTAEALATVAKTPEPYARKRKVSFGDAELGESHAQKPVKLVDVTPTGHAGTAEPSVAPMPAEEPPKKKPKKEATKAKDVESTQVLEAVEVPPAKAIGVPKPKPKKSAALARGSEAGTSAPKDTETTEPPAKKQKKQKKDDSAGPKKSSAPVDKDGIDQPIDQTDKSVNEASLQPAPEKHKRKSVAGGKTRSRKTEKTIGVCATIPQTNESTIVQSEVAAAILSDCLFKASEIAPPEPPARRKSVKRVTKKASASSSVLPVELATVLGASSNEIQNAPATRRLELEAQANEPPQQTPVLNGPPCPICLEVPFHIRYYCPTVLKGPGAIQERLEELKKTNDSDQQSLIKELEGLLRDSKAPSKPSLDAAQTEDVQSREVSPLPNASLPRTPNIPSNSYVSEVTVESRDEGSSSESSDELSDGEVEPKESPAPQGQQPPDEQPLTANEDLEAVIRGPMPKQQSVLHLIDHIVGDEEDDGQDSDEEEVKAELEEDRDEEVDRSRRRMSRQSMRFSDSESEDEDEESRSPSRSAEGNANDPDPSAQGPNKPAEGSATHQDNDVVMKDAADPPTLEGQDDGSSEETHVGSEDRMVVDHESIGDKDAATVVEQQPSSPAPRSSVLPPCDAPSNELQKSGLDAPNRDGSVPVTSGVANEVEADPIEPADDLEPPTTSRSPNVDPIEVLPEDIGSLFTGLTQSTPKPGVAKRIKTRDGQIPNDDDERPVLLAQLASEATDAVTPLPTKGKSRRKTMEMSAIQELVSVWKSTSTPVAVALLNHKVKAGTRSGRVAKTPAKRLEECSDALQNSTTNDNATQNGARIAATPSFVRWETIADPSSPLPQLDEPSVHIDELMSSSPHPEDKAVRGRLNKGEKGRPRKAAPSIQPESSQGKERLFDLSSSQIPFPYSQQQPNPASSAIPNGKEREETTDSEEEAKVTKKKTKRPMPYRPLSQLASQAALFSPSLPTPVSKSMTEGKAKQRVVEDSSSSSSSDGDEVNGSEHIPRGRRAGSVFETKKRRKESLLSTLSPG